MFIKELLKNIVVFLLGLIFIWVMGELFVIVFNKYKAFNEMDLPKYRTYDNVVHHKFVPN